VRSRLLPLLPTPLVFVLGAWASGHVAERAGAAAADALASVAVLARSPFGSATPAPDPEVIPTDAPALAEPGAATLAKAGKTGKQARPSGAPVVFVSRDAVLSLANSGARPHAVPVPATSLRPAGLCLAGVAALGVGLRDGDVLTRALGQPAVATSAVIQAVLVARAHHAAVLDGEFWRGDQRFILRVEQPYPDERRSDAAEPGRRLTLLTPPFASTRTTPAEN
jgi:hypothetical protein